jgi:hypothetical protein
LKNPKDDSVYYGEVGYYEFSTGNIVKEIDPAKQTAENKG